MQHKPCLALRLFLFCLLLLELYNFRSDRVFTRLHWNAKPSLRFALHFIQFLLTILKTIIAKSLCLFLGSLSANWARLWLLIYSNFFASFENMFSWLDALLLQTTEQGCWRHLSWIPNDEIIDVVVVYDVGYVRCLFRNALVVFLICYWRLLLFELFVFVRRNELTRSFSGLLIVWRDHLRLLFAGFRLFLRFKVAHLKRLHYWLFRFLCQQQIIRLLFCLRLNFRKQIALASRWLDFGLLWNFYGVRWKFQWVLT